MIAPPSSHLSISGTGADGTGAALTGAALASSSAFSGMTGGGVVFESSRFKCVTLMRHSIAAHNEAAAVSADAIGSVYLSEAYADSSLSHRGHTLVRGARQSMLGLSPAPDIVICSPLTRSIQTAIAMFRGTGIRIVAVPGVREAYGKYPCDRHRDRSELELMFGDTVDFSLCGAKDTLWSPHRREDISQLNDRVARFVDSVVRSEEGHIFVVTHGVFMEAAIRQLTFGYPGRDVIKKRLHNCEVHSFVFSSPTPLPPAATNGATAPPPVSALRPRVEAYLSGQGLVLACAAGIPLPAVAHINSVLRRFSAGGISLTEKRFSNLLARCGGLGAQEIRWLFCSLDREGGGRVASGDLLLALMAFYPGEGRAAEAARAGRGGAQAGLMNLRMRYQREMSGTPLANYELLKETYQRILSSVLSTR